MKLSEQLGAFEAGLSGGAGGAGGVDPGDAVDRASISSGTDVGQ